MSDNTRWGPDYTLGDAARKIIGKKYDLIDRYQYLAARQQFHPLRSAQLGLVPDPATDGMHFWADYIYEKYGRPKWFVDDHVFDLLMTLKPDDMNLDGIFLPHDSFKLIFEYGTMLHGKPLRSILAFHPKAALTDKFIDELAPGLPNIKLGLSTVPPDENAPERSKAMIFLMDAGENGFTKQYSWDTPLGMGCCLIERRRMSDPLFTIYSHDLNLREGEKEYMQAAVKLFVSAMLYAATGSDRAVAYAMPRSCRYNYHGDKATYRRMLCPKARQHAGAGDGTPTGREMKGHYRGWVLAVLRDKRWKRNPDGTFKVSLKQPCAVNGGFSAEEIEKLA